MSTSINKEYTAGCISIQKMSKTKALLTTDLGKRYIVNSDGSVDNLSYNGRNGCVRACKFSKDAGGYSVFSVALSKGSKQLKVHQLVALAFIPNPKELPIINHKNENPSDNRVENLEWCTHKYNVNYGTRNKRASESFKATLEYPHPIVQIWNNYIVKVFCSLDELKNSGLDSCLVLEIAKGIKGGSYRRSEWKFLPSEEMYESYRHPKNLTYAQIVAKTYLKQAAVNKPLNRITRLAKEMVVEVERMV